MALPTQLNATEQDTLVKQIGLSLLRAAPRDWRRVTAEYRAAGRYHELTGEIEMADGATQEWVATHDIAALFGRLRAGMYREGRGTWFNARYHLDHPSSYNLEYDRDEPRWDLAPPPQAYADELRMFPRIEENVPDWLMRRMAGLGPERPGPRFRIARIFDGTGASGRPVINRPELEAEERDRLLDYLDGAPVVVPGRGYDIDRLAGTQESTVPIAFHSDGTWIWPAAVNYYLREYGIAPEPELLGHIRATGFSIPDVPDPVRQAAAAHISRGGPPPQPQHRPVPLVAEPRPPVVEEPRPPESEPQSEDQFEDQFDEDPAERTRIAEPLPSYDDPAERTRIAQPLPSYDDRMHDDGVHDRGGHDDRIHGEAGHRDQAHDDRSRLDRAHDDRAHADEQAQYDSYGEHDGYDEAGHYEDSGYDEPALHARQHPDPGAPQEDDQATRFTPLPNLGNGPPATIASAPPPLPPTPSPVAQHAAPQPPGADDGPRLSGHEQRSDEQSLPPRGHHDDGGPPTQYSPMPPAVDEPVLDQLQDKLEDLGVPESAYCLGEPAERGWALEEIPEGWRVGWYDGALTSPAVFGDAEDAAAFMLGKLLLAPGGANADTQHPRQTPTQQAQARQAPAPPSPAPAPQPTPRPPAPEERPAQPAREAAPPRPVTATLSPEVATGARAPSPSPSPEPAADAAARPAHAAPIRPGRDEPPVAGGRRTPGGPVPAGGPPAGPRRENGRSPSEQGGQQQWPIRPFPGEPPLTLFRGKEVRELPAGSELDRFGGPDGNLTYAAGTPFEERSLVPEWVSRPYHVYRVQRPLEALAGVAIPWFNQPGGGAAYLLPTSIEELLAEGDLIELDPGEPPVE